MAKTLSKEETKVSKANFKQPPPVNFLAQRRKEAREKSAENRYKVVNYHRSLDTSNIEEFEDKMMTVVDIEDSALLAVDQNTETAATEEEDEKKVCAVAVIYLKMIL